MTQADPPLGRGGAVLLLATVFASGAAVMILEMTAVRAVQPYFGSTTVVWTNVIAVVLAALAAGYALGGRLADRRPSRGLLYGLSGPASVLVAWLVTPVSALPPDRCRPGGGRLGAALGFSRHGRCSSRRRSCCSALAPIAIRSRRRPGAGRGIRVRALDRSGRSSAPTCTLVLVPGSDRVGRSSSRPASSLAAAAGLRTSAATGAVGGARPAPRGGLLAAVGLLARAGSQPPRPDPAAAQPPSGASRR